MATRTVARLVNHRDGDVIRLPSKNKSKKNFKVLASDTTFSIEENGRQESFQERKMNSKTLNPFMSALLAEIDTVDQLMGGSGSDTEEPAIVSQNLSKANKSKKKKKKKKQNLPKEKPAKDEEDIDAILDELKIEPDNTHNASQTVTSRSSLSVDKRFLNADNELRKIFGSKIVNSGRQKRNHKMHYKTTLLVQAKDTWPRMDKAGLTMELIESKEGRIYFLFKHSLFYQQAQFSFWQAVASLDHNNIAGVLNLYPYHIDSLLQLSDVCRMQEDYQMAADLIERAIYCLESSFHPLFNLAQTNCRLDYKYQENRSIFIALFRHLATVSNKGCHRTALEFCKLLLGLNPEDDPLGTLLMIDFYALKAEEYNFLLQLAEEYEATKRLSQLPNFAFSLPLTLHCLGKQQNDKKMLEEADEKLQNALTRFPTVLLALLDKCGVVVESSVSASPHFKMSPAKDPIGLQILNQLFIERNHHLWKIPDVLTWLVECAKEVVKLSQSSEPIFKEYSKRNKMLYEGTPRTICRHVVVSEFQSVNALLPRHITSNPILAYDPLPPSDSVAGYSMPHTQVEVVEEGLISLFWRSLLPSYNPQTDHGPTSDQPGPLGAAGNLMDTLRDLLVHLQPPQGQGEGEGDDNGLSDESLD